jgi:hypothetical protein
MVRGLLEGEPDVADLEVGWRYSLEPRSYPQVDPGSPFGLGPLEDPRMGELRQQPRQGIKGTGDQDLNDAGLGRGERLAGAARLDSGLRVARHRSLRWVSKKAG